MHFGPSFSHVATLARAPFSAEEVDEDEQTLADGVSIHHTRQGMKIYRDSMGRTRTEHVLLGSPVERIPAEGTKTTTTWPTGSVGNDRPIVSISESWTSPDLKEIILRKSDDPRSGERTHKLVNISRSEPDTSLFGPPPGYTVNDEEREFTIDWNPAH